MLRSDFAVKLESTIVYIILRGVTKINIWPINRSLTPRTLIRSYVPTVLFAFGFGAIHKVSHARGGPRRCDSLWQSVWRHTFHIFHTYETTNWKWCLAFCCNGCILTEGGRTKTTPSKTFQTKNPRTKPSRQEPPRTKTNVPIKTYVCMHVLLKMGVPRCVTMCDRKRGSKLVQNCVTYFMDGPFGLMITSWTSRGWHRTMNTTASNVRPC